MAAFEEYVEQEWRDLPDRSTPFTADRMMHIESGIKTVSDRAAAAVTSDEIAAELPALVDPIASAAVAAAITAEGGVTDAVMAAVQADPESDFTVGQAARIDTRHLVRTISAGQARTGAAAEWPTLIKPLDSPILSFADQGAESIVWPRIIDRWALNPEVDAAERWMLTYATDHASSHMNSGIFYATAPSPLQTFTAQGLLYRDDVTGSETEMMSVVADPKAGVWRCYYTQGGAPSDASSGTSQATIMATSTDLTPGSFTRVGPVAQFPGVPYPGNGHSGYMDVWTEQALWLAYTLQGGSNSWQLKQSRDGITWSTDRHRLPWQRDMLSHIDGFDQTWFLKTLSGKPLYFRGGDLWLIGLAGGPANEGEVVDNHIIAGRLTSDRRALRSRPMDVTPTDDQPWELDHNYGIGNIFTDYDLGRTFMPYRQNGLEGDFGLLEII